MYVIDSHKRMIIRTAYDPSYVPCASRNCAHCELCHAGCCHDDVWEIVKVGCAAWAMEHARVFIAKYPDQFPIEDIVAMLL